MGCTQCKRDREREIGKKAYAAADHHKISIGVSLCHTRCYGLVKNQ